MIGQIALARAQTRELLEVHIGLAVVVEALEFALATESEQPSDDGLPRPNKFRQLYDDLIDPVDGPLSTVTTDRPKIPVDTLMARYGVKLPEILALIGQRNLGMAIAQSGPRLARVIDGVGEAAEPKTVPCDYAGCVEGYIGVEPDPDSDEGEDAPDIPRQRCPKCRGIGLRRVMGDLDAAKLFVNWHGGPSSGGKGGGPSSVTVIANAQASSRSDSRQRKDEEPITVRVQKIIEQ